MYNRNRKNASHNKLMLKKLHDLSRKWSSHKCRVYVIFTAMQNVNKRDSDMYLICENKLRTIRRSNTI